MPPFNFCGPSYQAASPIIDDEIAMNCYCEQSESPGAATKMALLRTPGKKIFAQLAGENSVPCLYFLNGRLFAACSHLYELAANGTVTHNYGSIGTAPVTPTQILANENQLLILNNGNLYVFTFKGAITAASIHAGAAGTGYVPGDTGTILGTGSTYTVLTVGGGGAVATFAFTPGENNVISSDVATNTITGVGTGFAVDITAVQDNYLSPVDMTQFPGLVAQIGFGDGYFIATIQNSHTFLQSNLEDGTVWQGVDEATLSYFPDNIASMVVDHRELWFWSNKKAVGYYNSGSGFPVWIPIQGNFLETGAAAAFGTLQIAERVLFISQDERGIAEIKALVGTNAERISTHAVELALQSYAKISDAVGWTYQESGHQFAVFYFPSANNGQGATWAYDVTESERAGIPLWHQRGYWNAANGSYSADRAMSHAFAFGLNLVGDWASGNVYILSSAYLDDFGNLIRGNRRTPSVQKENKWLYFEQIEFVLETGLAPATPLADGDGQPRPAQLMLRWSNDGGQTWSNTYFLSVGFQGEYRKRVIKRMLGRARKRLWDVTWTDPYAFRFNDAFLEAKVMEKN